MNKLCSLISTSYFNMPIQDCFMDLILKCCPNELPSIRGALLVVGLESAVLLGKN